MLTYNTQLPQLTLPEYGRNIQQMVDHCLTIEDRDERTRCAHAIVACMGKLFPKMQDQEEWRRKMWDHLAIMSGFRLDIDYPYEVVSADNLHTQPETVPYTSRRIRYRHYGKDIELLINRAIAMEPGEERDELTYLIADHMKKMLTALNPDGVEDTRVFKDLAEMSHGELMLDPGQTRLHEFKIIAPPSGKKKKKRQG